MNKPPAVQENSSENNLNSSGNVSWFKKLRDLIKLRSTPTLKESLEEVMEEHDASGAYIDPEEKEMIHNVLTFSELRVEDVMIPKADIVGIPYDITLPEIKEFISSQEHSFTRVPVYRETMDEIPGFIHIKDLARILAGKDSFKIDDIIRQVLFVPPSMKVKDLLVNMRIARVHMAIVVDEFGGTAGLATLGDLIEEIVGEIDDEHDTVEDVSFTDIGKDIIKANARTNISELENKLGTSLRLDDGNDDYDTIGGLIYSLTDRIPITGELIHHPCGFEFEITEADPRAIKTVIIRKTAPTTNGDK